MSRHEHERDRESVVDPTEGRVLERNYDYAQKNVRLLSMWYECEPRRMLELLAEHDIELSRNDERQFGAYYQTVQRHVTTYGK
ncbi:hypothetical protein [Natronorubrum sulfidifaciens]|uniref:Uncharacterized protein n=1 Tax=Natronorubrum sulfidifaciens JCM 14089 TaxID=1230460 RepID=L9VYQ2_9EURY|nr:hypothetical protein [Natronorubrum sulfidifaciens]ELY42320.1 hypothetical protein C495_14987 [Natronorubrum sulfidifaciens JCM 14089]